MKGYTHKKEKRKREKEKRKITIIQKYKR